MRVLFLGNNRAGWEILRWLKSEGEDIVGVVVHPNERQKFGDEILRDAVLPADRAFVATDLRRPETLARIGELAPDVGVSVFFGYILRADLLTLFPSGCINVHPAYLPYNRGAYPNVWSIVEGTTAGATVHYMDEGVDTGDIIARRQVPVEPVDTGETLYRKLEDACIDLFREAWPLIRSGTPRRIPQSPAEGTYHTVRDVERIDEIDLDRRYTGRELLDIIRARSFPPHPGAYFRKDGRKVYVQLHLRYADESAD